MKYKSYSATSFKHTPYYHKLSSQQQNEFNIVTKILHFKVNNYVLENLINWEDLENDPIYKLTFPQRGMVLDKDYQRLENRIEISAENSSIEMAALVARKNLYPPHMPTNDNHIQIDGLYHLFPKTLELFPTKASTCHSYCTYCHRWMPLVEQDARYTYSNDAKVIEYLQAHSEIEDVIFSGGDPMVMSASSIKKVVEPIIAFGQIKSIRFISKSLAWWPYRYTTDEDAQELLTYFDELTKRNIHVTFVAHFTHPKELQPQVVQQAIANILRSGVVIRCQGPIVKGINDDADILAELWKKQVQFGMVPYYLFVEFNYGPTGYFKIPIAKALEITQQAIRNSCGLVKTIRGPVISDKQMKLCIEGTVTIAGNKMFVLKCINSHQPENVGKIFFEKFDEFKLRLALDLIESV
ncbi:KamA family radical SAM protein [Psychromonas hadalis]|uniref:KamA family radical SAM protein n=1 Tax=Psychromonas hadalis TaxID=211669 RepID=UPI0003B430AF|nr:4Fe-4S cluster-binding domain-containing protein [Psychromonas hadalis]